MKANKAIPVLIMLLGLTVIASCLCMIYSEYSERDIAVLRVVYKRQLHLTDSLFRVVDSLEKKK